MKKTILNLFILLASGFAFGQTTIIINYNFNSTASYPAQPTFNETGISCAATSTEPFQVFTGVASGNQAFVANSTSGNAIAMVNSSGNNSRYFQFHLSGNELNLCSSYKLYFQTQRSSNGASLITVAYSTDGVNFTNHGTTYNVALNFTETVVNLTSVSTINNVNNLYIRLQCSGAISSTGTIRIDNFQVQANKTTSPGGGGGNNPWQVNGNDVSFIGKIGIGNATPLFPLDVTGDAKISNNVNIAGAINIGNLSDSISIGTALAPNGARIITFGKTRPTFPFPLPTTCMEPLQPGNLGLSNRVVLANSPSQNLLDFTNTGSNGLIDYGFDINQFKVFNTDNPGAPRPALKINSKCWGDVELAKGGGFVSTGNYFEVGNPARNGNITSNINSVYRIGQRITVSSQYPENFPNFPDQYNSQFFVNRTKTRALAVFNTLNSPEGEETFSVYGDGRVAIGSSYVANGYKLAVHGKVIAEEVVIQLRNTWPDYVFNKDYKLMPLDILEKYLTANKHLPNIPSEKELKENGISTSDMLNKQMEKIEELTLYLIEQQKQINELKKQLEAVK